MKSTLSLFAISTLLLSFQVNGEEAQQEEGLIAAAQMAPQRNMQQNVTNVEQRLRRLEARDNLTTETTVYGNLGPKIPAHPKKSSFYVSGDYLFWQSELDGTMPGFLANFSEAPDLYLVPKNLDFDWRSGFRVGMGYHLDWHDDWNVQATWTSINGKGSASPTADLSTLDEIFLTIGDGDDPFAASSFTATWKIKYNTVDLEFIRDYLISSHVTLTPYAGIRGAWIHQKYADQEQAYFLNLDQSISPSGLFSTSQRCFFNGVGLRGGACLQWHFTKNLNLIGTFAASLLRGHFNITNNIQIPGTSDGEVYAYSQEKIWRNQINLEEGLGLQWEMMFNKNKQGISITALYENSQWLRMNRFYVLDPAININQSNFAEIDGLAIRFPDDDVSFQGLTIDLTVDF